MQIIQPFQNIYTWFLVCWQNSNQLIPFFFHTQIETTFVTRNLHMITMMTDFIKNYFLELKLNHCSFLSKIAFLSYVSEFLKITFTFLYDASDAWVWYLLTATIHICTRKTILYFELIIAFQVKTDENFACSLLKLLTCISLEIHNII